MRRFPSESQTQQDRFVHRASLPVGILMAWVMVLGCSSDLDDDFPSSTTTVNAIKAPFLALILPSSTTEEAILWNRVFMSQATSGKRLYVGNVYYPDSSDESVTQADLIRRAVRERNQGLLVLPDDSAKIAPALEEARAEGVEIVLLEREVPTDGEPFDRVAHGPLAEISRDLVEAALEDLKELEITNEGQLKAMLVMDAEFDSESQARREAITTALNDQEVSITLEFFYDKTKRPPSEQIREQLEAHPEVAIVVGGSDDSMSTISNYRVETDGADRFVVIGYCCLEGRGEATVRNGFSAGIVNRRSQYVLTRAVDTLLVRLGAEIKTSFEMGPLVLVEPAFRRRTGDPITQPASPERGRGLLQGINKSLPPRKNQ